MQMSTPHDTLIRRYMEMYYGRVVWTCSQAQTD